MSINANGIAEKITNTLKQIVSKVSVWSIKQKAIAGGIALIMIIFLFSSGSKEKNIIDNNMNPKMVQDKPKDKNPLSISNSKSKKSYGPSGVLDDIVNDLTFTAVVDEVTVNSITLNRGQCGKSGNMKRPLKFGQSLTMKVNCKQLIEVEVTTDMGAWTYNF